MNCEELKAQISGWFNQELQCHANGNTFSLALPLQKPDGDFLEIGLESLGSGRWRITDFGDTQAHFYLAGIDLSETSRGDEFRQIIQDFKINNAEQELSMETSADQLSAALFDFTHVLQSILALQFTVRPQLVSRDFQAIVARFFFERRVLPEMPATPFPGKSGNWKFNFILNRVKSPTLVKTLSAQKSGSPMTLAERSVFEINDLHAGGNQTPAVVVLDDEGERAKGWTPRVLRVFDEYGIRYFPFEAKQRDLENLAKEYAV